MIRYPVKHYYDDEVGGYTIEDREHKTILHIQAQSIDFHAKAIADMVVNSLNAMNQCEEPTHKNFPDKSSVDDVDHMEIGLWYHDWYNRFFKKQSNE